MIKSSLKLTLLLLFIALIILLLCGTGFQYGGLRVSLAEATRAKSLLYTGRKVELANNTTLTQSFVANYPGLSQIDVLFVGQPEPQPVILTLKATCAATDVILSQHVDLPPADDLTYYSFTFEPLDDSVGQNYCLALTAPEGSVQIQLSGGDLYPFGELEIHTPEIEQADALPAQNKPVVIADMPYKIYLPIVMIHPQDERVIYEDIGFLLHYNGYFWPMAQVFAARLTANKPYIWGQPWFYAALVIVYAILLVGLFKLAWQMRGRSDE